MESLVTRDGKACPSGSHSAVAKRRLQQRADLELCSREDGQKIRKWFEGHTQKARLNTNKGVKQHRSLK